MIESKGVTPLRKNAPSAPADYGPRVDRFCRKQVELAPRVVMNNMVTEVVDNFVKKWGLTSPQAAPDRQCDKSMTF
jgi:hypothetical protein